MGSASASVLFEPLKLGPITLSNKIVMSALTRGRAIPTNIPNEVNVEYYKQRSNAGLIVTEGVLVSQQGTEWPYAPGIWSKEQVAGWKKVVDAVHAEGGHIFAQLWHVGRLSHPNAEAQKASGEPVWAPSAVSARGGKFRFIAGEPGYVTPTAIDDPTKLIELFKKAAVNAKEAGFDGVEIHGANGYVVHQFLDSTSNLRTDSWGGSVENRSRFGLELLKAVIDVWGKGRVSIKLSPAGGYNDMGMPLQETIDTYSYFIKEADKLGLAYITLVRYLEFTDPVIDGKKRATQHDILATYGPVIKNTPFIPNGGFTAEEAATLISEGKIAAASFGIPWIAHPDLAKRIKYGKPLDGQLDFTTLYWNAGLSLDDLKPGYTSYPAAKYD